MDGGRVETKLTDKTIFRTLDPSEEGKVKIIFVVSHKNDMYTFYPRKSDSSSPEGVVLVVRDDPNTCS